MTTSLHNKIFAKSGCISKQDILAYAKDELSNSEKHDVEKHLLDCPLCMDAIEGYVSLNPKSLQKTAAALTWIDNNIDELILHKDKTNKINYRLLVAATVAAIVLSGSVILFFKNTQNQIAELNPVTKDLKKNSNTITKNKPQQNQEAIQSNQITLSSEDKKKEESPSSSGSIVVTKSGNGVTQSTDQLLNNSDYHPQPDDDLQPEESITIADEEVLEVADKESENFKTNMSMLGGATRSNSEQFDRIGTDSGMEDAVPKPTSNRHDLNKNDRRQSESVKRKRSSTSPFKINNKDNKVLNVKNNEYKVVDYSGEVFMPESEIEDVIDASAAKQESDTKKNKKEKGLTEETSIIQLDYNEFIKEGLSKYENKQYKDALYQFQELLKYHPDDLNALFYSGMCNYFLGDIDAAMLNLSKVLEDKEKVFNEKAAYYLALSYKKAGNKIRAKNALQQIIEQDGFYRDRAIEEIKHLDD